MNGIITKVSSQDVERSSTMTKKDIGKWCLFDNGCFIGFKNTQEEMEIAADNDQHKRNISLIRNDLINEKIYSTSFCFIDIYSAMTTEQRFIIDKLSNEKLSQFINNNIHKWIKSFQCGLEGSEVCYICADNSDYDLYYHEQIEQIEMKLEDWLDKYKPIVTDTGNIKMYETFGKDKKIITTSNVSYIWTLVEGDNGKMYLLSGFHKVNRINYVITTIPRNLNKEISIEW